MANRVFDELRRWTALDDAALDEAIREDLERNARCRACARARGACSRWRWKRRAGSRCRPSTPSARGCCTSSRSRPTSRRASTVLDDAARGAAARAHHARACCSRPRPTPDGALGRALATAIALAADQTFKDVVAEAIRKRDLVRGWIDHAGGVDAAIARAVRDARRSTADDTIEAVEPRSPRARSCRRREWLAVAAMLARGSKSDQGQADAAASQPRARPARSASMLYLAVSSSPTRASRASAWSPAAFAKAHPELARAPRCRSRRACLRSPSAARRSSCRDRTAALLTIADAVIARYHAEKDRRGLLDYDDLIDKTLALLGEVRAAWVHYKLDRGIDHVLIDEAQDTSPKQWEIIRALTAEFFAGAGARVRSSARSSRSATRSSRSSRSRAPRRATSPRCAAFPDARYRGGRAADSSGASSSIRSAPVANVLGAVDTVFSGRRSTSASPPTTHGIPPHIALPSAAPGLVEIWPLIEPTTSARSKPGMRRSTPLSETSPQAAAGRKDRARTCSAGMEAGAARRATCWCWCASAGRCSRRSSARSRTRTSRSPAPTGWC